MPPLPVVSAPEGYVLPIRQDQMTCATEPEKLLAPQGLKEWPMKTSLVFSHGRPFPKRNGCLLELSQPCQFLLLSNVSLGFLPSCWPSCNDSNDIMWFQLENDLQPSATRAHTDQLVPIFESLVPADFILGEEALDCFLESNAMIGKLVALKIILEVGRLERMPIYQGTPSSSRRQTRVSHPAQWPTMLVSM